MISSPCLDTSREDTTLRRGLYLLDAQYEIVVSPAWGIRSWVHRALELRIAESRADAALLTDIWLSRHYLGRRATRPRVKVLSWIGNLRGITPGDAGAAVAVAVALQPSQSGPMMALRSAGVHPCSILELVRCWRADDLTPDLTPDLMPYVLRRVVNGGNGVRSLYEEWSERKLTNGLEAEPLVLITYADPGVGHDGGLYRGAGAIPVGFTGNGKLAFAWPLRPHVRAILEGLICGRSA